MNTFVRLLFIFVITSLALGLITQTGNSSSLPDAHPQIVAVIFSPPLGFQNGLKYGPRYMHDNNGNVIENTDYGIKNPDLSQTSLCFGESMSNLYHAGQDLYRKNGSSTYNDEVTAVADGEVFSTPTGNYPGLALVIRHLLLSGQYTYSVYMHLENVPSSIIQGQTVSRGQRLGTVIQQMYSGNYPTYHQAPLNDDSHLHFEMRFFPSAANIYTNYPSCNKGDAAGRGYTYPELPDNFPTLPTGYRNPRKFIPEKIFITPTLNGSESCIEGYDLLSNGGFELGHANWIENGYNIITNIYDPYLAITPHNGSWLGWLGGANNANDNIYQPFVISQSLSSAILSYVIWVGTDETAGIYDKFYVMLRNSNRGLIQQLDYFDNSYGNAQIWVYRSILLPDLTSWLGQNISINFEVSTDNSLITNFYIDDVLLTMVCEGSYQAETGISENFPAQIERDSFYFEPQPKKQIITNPTSVPYP